MLFQKPSLRTRVTFEAGMTQLGGAAIYLPEDAVMGAREAVRDVARNLERFVDAIVARTGPHEVVLELAAQASVPVINGLTLREHPCQALADVFTIREHLGRLDGAVVTFVGDGNNVYHSLALVGAALRDGGPARPPDRATGRIQRIVAAAEARAAESGGRLVFGQEPEELVARRGRRLHRRLDVDGPGSRDRGAPRRVRRLSRRRRPAGRRRTGRRRDALPAGAPRRGDHLVGDGRAAEPDLRAVGEPPARPEGAARRADRDASA